MFETDISKYYRKDPIKKFNLNQTMYSLIKNESFGKEKLYATGFMGCNMTYGKLFESADKLAAALYNEGLREGKTVSILTINMPVVQECLLALSKIGCTASWIDLRAKGKDLIKYINSTESEYLIAFENMVPIINEIINETNVKKVIVCSPKDYLNPIIKVLANLKDKKDGKEIELPNKKFVKMTNFVKNVNNVNILPVGFEKDRPSQIVQSSGSTGKPKQIVHTEYNFNSAVQKMAYTDLPFYEGNVMHISVPPFIIYGLGNSIYASMAFTMKAEMNPFVDENTVYNDLGKFDISLAAPLHYRYMYNKILELENEINSFDKNSSSKEIKTKLKEMERVLKGIKRANVFVSGGDKISAEEIIEMQQKFNKIIVNGYGNNEDLGAILVTPMFAGKPGSIGIPMHGIDIKIVDENNKIVKHGEIGELKISSDNLFVKYLNNPNETNKIKEIDENGKEWVSSGDLCYIDNDGFIFTKGRNRRIIKKEAFKISPDTIEEVIMNIPFVKECVVVGVNDKKSISVPMAFVVLNEEINDYDEAKKIVFEKCKQELPDYEVPSYVEIIEKIPYTQNNKYDFVKLENIGNHIVEKSIKKVLKLK